MNERPGSKTSSIWRPVLAVAVMAVITGCAQAPTRTQGSILFPELPQEPRIQFLKIIASEDSFKTEEKSAFRDFVVGEERKSNARRLSRPVAVAHGPGYLYVLDKTWGSVVQIDLETGEFSPISDPRAGVLASPSSIFVDRRGYIYLTDSKRSEILVFNEYGQFQQSYDTGDNTEPVDVVVGKDNLYFTNLGGNDIVIMDKATGEIIDTIGGIGEAEGLLNKPTHLTFDADENLYVVDFLNNRVQKFEPDGTFVIAFGTNTRFFGGVLKPKGLDVDRDGNVYLADAAFEMVTIFDSKSGSPRMPFGHLDRSNPDSPARLYLPTDVHIDYDNLEYFQKYVDPDFRLQYLVYVSNGLAAVSVYGFGKWTGSLTPRSKRRLQSDDIGSEPESTVRGLEEVEDAPEPD